MSGQEPVRTLRLCTLGEEGRGRGREGEARAGERRKWSRGHRRCSRNMETGGGHEKGEQAAALNPRLTLGGLLQHSVSSPVKWGDRKRGGDSSSRDLSKWTPGCLARCSGSSAAPHPTLPPP